MSARTIAERFRSGQYNSDDIQNVRAALTSYDHEFLDAKLAQYIKHVENIDMDTMLHYVRTADSGWHAYAVSQVLSGLSYRECKRADYVEQVVRFAEKVDWDNQDIARLAALLALPRVTKCTAQVKCVLRAAHHTSDNPVIRDAAITSAQAYFGIAPWDIQWGKGAGDLHEKVPPNLMEWLNADAQ